MPLLVVADRRLEDHRHAREARVGEQAGEGVEPELPRADVGVTVLPRAARPHRIVEVDALDRLEADGRLDLGDELLVAGRLVERVT